MGFVAFGIRSPFAPGPVLSRKAYALVHAAGQRIDGGNAAFQRVVGGLLIAGLFLLLVKRCALQQTNRPGDSATQLISGKWRIIWPWRLLTCLAGQTLVVICMRRALDTTLAGVVLAMIATAPLVVIP